MTKFCGERQQAMFASANQSEPERNQTIDAARACGMLAGMLPAVAAASRSMTAPQILIRRTRPTPSVIYPVFWQFAAKRQAIYEQRVAGLPAPWTDDPILTSYKFTNAFRAADRVSQYLIRLAYAKENASVEDTFLRVLLFKIFNKISTWEHLVDTLGLPSARSFDAVVYAGALTSLKASGESIYSGAYIMPSGGEGSKHEMHLKLIDRLLHEGMPERVAATRNLESLYRLLLAVPTFGPFLAFQYAIDLNYSTIVDHSEGEFVVAGPGALDGLSKCFTSLGDFTPADAIKWLAHEQGTEFSRYGLTFSGLRGRALQPIDVQNLFCEVSKYTRVSHPDVAGVANRIRIKQQFRCSGPPETPFFPPKWKLAPAVASPKLPGRRDVPQRTLFDVQGYGAAPVGE